MHEARQVGNGAPPLVDPVAVAEAAALFIDGGNVVECRVLNGRFLGDRSWPATLSGYFDSASTLANELRRVESATGIYATANPTDPSLLARCANRLKRADKGATTGDQHIIRRRFLLIDVDAKRAAGISSTDAEHEAAIAKAEQIREWLTGRGFPEPIIADSGNGGHLLFPIDEPADDGGLIGRCLAALAAKFDDETVKVDTTVGNPARIWKLPGTLAAKGDDTRDRPHRMARLLSVPDERTAAPHELLVALAAEAPREPETTKGGTAGKASPRKSSKRSGEPFDVQAFLERSGFAFSGPEPWKGDGRIWTLDVDPFNPDHANGEAHVEQHGNGAISAGCHHESCTWNWSDLRVLVDGELLGGKPPAETVDAFPVAQEFLDERHTVDDVPLLRHWCGDYLRWNGACWRFLYEAEVRADLVRFLDSRFSNLTRTAVANVEMCLKSLAKLSATQEMPSWLPGGDPGPPVAELVVTQSGIVDLPALVAGKPAVTPPTPRLWSSVALNYGFSTQAPMPERWLRFLSQLWPEDREAVELLQEWCGYTLTSWTALQKALLLIGPKRSGKGTVSRVLRALVGEANVTAPTLAGLASNFGLWPLVGKSLAIVGDARLSSRTDTAVVTERILSITGEDPLTVDRKFREPITLRLPTRVMVLSNELPRLADASGALASRFLVLRLTRSFYGEEDPYLTDRLLAELPGILLWAIEGWRRLRERGRFVVPESSRELIGEMEDLSSPVGAFLRERCHVDPQAHVDADDLFAAWRAWCETEGRQHAGDAAMFGRNLRAALPAVQRGQSRAFGSRRWIYRGLGLCEST